MFYYHVIATFNLIINLKNMPIGESVFYPKKNLSEKKLSFDYANIRTMAIEEYRKKLLLMLDASGPKNSDINEVEISKKVEEFEKKLTPDAVLSTAETNYWEKIRTGSEDLEETDRLLSKKLMESAAGIQ